jgi:uncharacterized protein involved in tolerance to divalent cations
MVSVRLVDAEYIVVFVTTASKHEAEEIVQHLLGDKLIACGNIIGPVTSFFGRGKLIEPKSMWR